MNTQYFIASKADMISIYENFDLTERMGWPVVVAKRKNKIVGFLGTQDREDMVVAGPVEVKLKIKAFVLKNLIEIYDALLKKLGMKEYLFSVDKKQEKWIAQIEILTIYEKVSETDDYVWFKRIL